MPIGHGQAPAPLYSGKLLPDELGISLAAFQKALAAEGVPMTPGITPFGYGKMHAEPLFNAFPFDGFGGPWGAWTTPATDPRRPQPRGSLPVTEALAGQIVWLTTPVDPDPVWVDQVTAACRKVVENARRGAEVMAATV